MDEEKHTEIEMRKKIVAGNWKMNLSADEAVALTDEINNQVGELHDVELMIFPSTLYIHELAHRKGQLKVGAQNFHPSENGAYTGEVSITQIKNSGATHALVGHSERRALFGENSSFLKSKVDSALHHDITPVFCCGEPLEIREAGEELEFVKQQLIDSLFHLSASDIQKTIIAYEPVWAIGTGKTASVQQAESMHFAIRNWLSEKYDLDVANSISILYGGSCNTSNAKELFACPNVDGGLIGGASLQADSFITIARSF